MRRLDATLVAVLFASACGGKVVLDATGSSTSGSSSSTGIGGAGASTTSFSSAVGSMGGFSSSSDFSATSTSSTSPASTGDVNPGCGSFQESPSPACQGCASGACCGELQACDTGTPCAALAGCLAMCAPADSTCAAQCAAQNQAGATASQALDTCFYTNCSSNPACAVPICDSGASTPLALCAACIGATCCDTLKACIADMTCVMCLEQMNMGTQCTGDPVFTKVTACLGECTVQCD